MKFSEMLNEKAKVDLDDMSPDELEKHFEKAEQEFQKQSKKLAEKFSKDIFNIAYDTQYSQDLMYEVAEQGRRKIQKLIFEQIIKKFGSFC